jgi:hypothetical protein
MCVISPKLTPNQAQIKHIKHKPAQPLKNGPEGLETLTYTKKTILQGLETFRGV